MLAYSPSGPAALIDAGPDSLSESKSSSFSSSSASIAPLAAFLDSAESWYRSSGMCGGRGRQATLAS